MVVLFLMITLALAIAAKIYNDTNYFKINKIEFQSDKIPNGSEFTILQISDLHNKIFGNNNEELISIVKKLKPNIIVLTGDLIDRRTKQFKDIFFLAENLTSINKNVFFVTGNHEWGNPHVKEFLNGLRERNITILDNKKIQIIAGKLVLNLVGVEYYSTNRGGLKEALDGLNMEQYTILLSHSPVVADIDQVDLILSGHTHGGQVRLPMIGALVVPDQGFFPKFTKGIYKLGEHRYLYIDSGLGTSRLPIRFLNKSQISLIKIKNN